MNAVHLGHVDCEVGFRLATPRNGNPPGWNDSSFGESPGRIIMKPDPRKLRSPRSCLKRKVSESGGGL